MLYDHRTYRCRPGTINKHLDLYLEAGWDAQRRHLGEPAFYAQTETGDPNAYIHVWQYQDAADRAARRAAMAADPDWQNFIKLSAEASYLESQQNTLMIPTKFFKP